VDQIDRGNAVALDLCFQFPVIEVEAAVVGLARKDEFVHSNPDVMPAPDTLKPVLMGL
jgi:hypothetical protein